MKVLITGSNGFIGSHVVDYFVNKSCFVIGLGSQETSKTSNVDDYVKCDLGHDNLDAILASKQIDAVVHLAADMRKDPYCVDVVQTNCVGTQKLLEYCEKNHVKAFVELSSMPVIGYPIEHPITEKHPLNPYTVYHVTKVVEEMLSEYAYVYKGLRTASFRISAPIGPRMNEKTIFSVFCHNALENKEITLWGKGTRKQNFVHVRDIAQALYRGIVCDGCHGVYNLTSDLLISNYDLAKMIIERTGSKSKIVFNGLNDPADDYIWDASIEKIKNDIGYIPEVKIEEAIDEYVQFIKEKNTCS